MKLYRIFMTTFGFRLFSLLILIICVLKDAMCSSQETKDNFLYKPWFTGPLFTPTPITMDPRHPIFEPSLQVICTWGEYDQHGNVDKSSSMWSIKPVFDFQMGLTKVFGLEIIPSFVSSFKNGRSTTNWSDTILRFGIQLSREVEGSWIPDFRLIIQEVFPTGNYTSLRPENLGIDSTGKGSYQTGPFLVYHKNFHVFNNVRASIRSSVGYLIPTKAKVNGFNTFGGGYGTKGIIDIGNNFQAYFSGEIAFTWNWAGLFELIYFHNDKSSFKGTIGRKNDGTPAEFNLGSSNQLSLALELDHTFSSNLGMLIGSWFTLYGRNSTAFLSNFVAFLYIF